MKQNWLRVSIFVLAATTAVLNVMFAGCAKSPEEQRLERIRRGDETLNIILISIDTLRADALGCYGGDIVPTPNIDRLAAEGTLFAECKSPVPITLPSHTTMLTGTSPLYHGVHTNTLVVPDDGLRFLPEILVEYDYRTSAFIGGAPLDDVFGFNQGFEFFDDRFSNGYETPADIIWARTKAWISENGNKKFFVFMHLFDPHQPRTPPARFANEGDENLYYGEVAFVDEVVGELINYLKETGLANNTLVILTSDHGESLGEHGELDHSFFLYETTQHVPLIFYCPGLIPGNREIAGTVRLMDIFPTVLAILGIRISTGLQGESLIPYIYNNKDKANLEVTEESYAAYYMFGWSKIGAIEKGGWKYIDAPNPELYNLSEDPREINNVIDVEPTRAETLAVRLNEIEQGLSADGLGHELNDTIPGDMKEKLSALGYLSNVNGHVYEPGVDPKEKKEYLRLFIKYSVAELSRVSSFDENVGILEKMILIEPTQSYPYFELGKIYAVDGKFDAAERYLREAIEIDPGIPEPHLYLAQLYIELGRYDDARGIIKDIEEVLPTRRGPLAHFYLIKADYTAAISGPIAEAIKYYEKALSLDRDLAPAYKSLVELYLKSPGGGPKVKEYAGKFLELEPRGENAARMRAILGQAPVEELASKAGLAYEAGDYEKAAELCRRAYEMDPSYYEMRYNLACCLTLGGRPDEAIDELETLVRDAPGVFDEALAKDTDLESLRGREDFKLLTE